MDDKKRNITGSYPGSGGATKPQRRVANPAGTYPGRSVASPIKKTVEKKPLTEILQEEPKVDPIMEPAAEPFQQPTTEPKAEQRDLSAEAEQEGEVQEKKRLRFSDLFSKRIMKKYGKTLAYYGGILIASVLLSAWLCDVGNEFLGLVRPDKEITFIIEEKKTSVAEVAAVLEESELINHSGVFEFYCGLKKAEGTFESGEFTINCQSDYNQIIRRLQSKGGEQKSVKFTINPGDTQEDFVTLLCDSLKCYEREELEEVLQNYDFSEYSFLSNLPERNYRLEGYLYPGKYETYEGESAVAVIRHILDRFEEKVLTEDNQKLITESGYTLDELITLSSILQKEGGTDLAKSAGVYFNRLADETFPYLESQATLSYVLPMRNGELTKTELLTDDPYNTYLKEGLPPGAICSPGSKAIKAVLEPKETDYMFFVTKSDDKTLYAVKESGHRSNLKKGGEDLRGTGTIA